MQEILFRGRRRYNGEWVEGSLVHIGDFCAIVEHDQERLHDLDKMYLDASTGTMDGYATKVPFETVGQYVGLNDRDGKKIFEGDILESPIKRVGQKLGNLIVVTDIRECKYMALYVSEYIVIGNIHDNPELLEVK